MRKLSCSFLPLALMISFVTLLVTPVVGWCQAATGYKVTDFATEFPNSGLPRGAGPIGLTFDASGDLFVMDYITGFLYKFGPAGGVASAPVNATAISGAPAGLAFGKDGSLFVARQSANDVLELDPSTGTIIRTVAGSLPNATGIATDPLSGDLFVSGPFGGYVARISNFASGPGTVATYASTGFVDGLAFGPDGTLYGALSGAVAKITGTNSPTPGAVTRLPVSVPFIDGMAISGNPSVPFLYGNRNDGIITKIDLSTTPPTLTNVFTGGSRGDFVAVGPDGCLYATQTDRVLKVTNADGSCLGGPLGPLFPSSPGNLPPVCTAASAEPSSIWPPNHIMVPIIISGVTDADGDPVTITATSVFQNEPVLQPGFGSGHTAPDAFLNPLLVRAERDGTGGGRIYTITFNATDGKGASCAGQVKVCVPHDRGSGSSCVDNGPLFNSLVP
jgi:hypothetical protein